MKIEYPKFENKKEFFDYLAKNAEDHIYAKKSEIKFADSVDFGTVISKGKFNNKTSKADLGDKEIRVKAIINTTKILDSHEDVHIDGLWDKSLSENKRIKFLQEHVNKFDHIIADKEDLKAYTINYTWKDLGFDFDGETEALEFDANVKADRNSFMFKQYKDGNVDNHSVGMNYVKIYFALNSEEPEHAQYKENWSKFRPLIVNGEDADRKGYFYAVTEAKVREGSSVVDGSNFATPTLLISNKEKQVKEDPFLSWLKGDL